MEKFTSYNAAAEFQPSHDTRMESFKPFESMEDLEPYFEAAKTISSENEKSFRENKWTQRAERFLRYVPVVAIALPTIEAIYGKSLVTKKEFTPKERALLFSAALARTLHWVVLIYGAEQFAAEGNNVEAMAAGGTAALLARLGDYINTLAIPEDAKDAQGVLQKLNEFSKRLKITTENDREGWDAALREQENLQNLFPYKIV